MSGCSTPRPSRGAQHLGCSAPASRSSPDNRRGASTLPKTLSVITNDPDEYGPQSVQVFSLDGRALSTAVPVPSRTQLVASVLDGYLAQTDEPGSPRLRLLEPDAATFTRDVGAGASAALLGAGGNTIALRGDEPCHCTVHLLDQTTVRDVTVTVPGYVIGYEGDRYAMSADGARFAVGLEHADRAAFALDIIDTHTAQGTITPLSEPIHALLWSADAKHLFLWDDILLSVVGVDNRNATPLGRVAPAAVLAIAS